MSAILAARLEILEIELQTVRMLASQVSATPARIAAARIREKEIMEEISRIPHGLNQSPIPQVK